MEFLKRFWPRMLLAMLVSLFLFVAAHAAQQLWPGTLLSVSLYKAHLITLGGWAGYWLDRGLFPYGRPHKPLEAIDDADAHGAPALFIEPNLMQGMVCTANDMMLRRAIVAAACVIAAALAA